MTIERMTIITDERWPIYYLSSVTSMAWIYIYETFIGNEIWQTQRSTTIRDRGTNKQ